MGTCPGCGLPAPAGSRFCAGCGSALAAEPPVRRCLVTVLFCDMVGSTALGERLDAEVLRAVQRRYFAACSGALDRHGGQIEKFIGDAVMCVFGLPRAREDDALRACRGARDILAAVEELSDELEAELGVRLEVRVGVNTGEVVTGDPSRGQALVTGDTVNTAARLEQAAGSGEVFVGETTARLVSGDFALDVAAPVHAKGKAEPVRAHRLGGAAGPRDRQSESPLVGRADALRGLLDAFARVTEQRRPDVSVLVGDPGIGKSRLVAELSRAVSSGALVLTGHCPSYGEGLTWWPLGEAVEQLVGNDDDDLAGMVGDAPAAALLRAIGRAPGAVTRDEVFAATVEALGRLAAKRPVVLVLEDLHWAEPTLLDLIDHVLVGAADMAVLVVATARPELAARRPDLVAAATRLEPLERAAADGLLQARGVADPGRRALLVGTAGGNPLFLEQLAAAGDAERLPPSLRALLGARLDVLQDDHRELLEVAAVVGREFWPDAVAALLGRDEVDVAVALAELTAAELVVAGRADGALAPPAALSGVFGAAGRQSFRHALVRDAAYAALPKARAADLHEAFGAYIERRAGERAAEFVPVLGWHLEQAARLRLELRPRDAEPAARRAAQVLAEAGQRALEQEDPRAAEKLLRRAEDLGATGIEGLSEALERSHAGAEAISAAAPDVLLRAGDVVAGHRIVAMAGRGGMGVVYQAVDLRLTRTVALKVIAPAFASDPGFRQRFERESRLAAQLEHPNVVPVYGAGSADKRLYIAMRFIDGTDLATALTRNGRLDPAEVVALITQVAAALDAAHARGLVHRDVKPANVLLTGDASARRAYLTDFGLAIEGARASGMTRAGEWVGTLGYVAPEQLRGRPLDGRADVYALGGVVHHCLTGALPYPGRQGLDAVGAHLSEPPPRPTSVVAGLPAGFDAVVARAMAKDPDARYASAGALAAELGVVAAGGRLTRRPVRSKMPRRRLAAAGGLMLAAAAAAALLTAGGGGGSPSPPRRGLAERPISVPGAPEHLAVAGASVWAMVENGGRLMLVDGGSRSVRAFPAPVDLGGGPRPDLAALGGTLWAVAADELGGVDAISQTTPDAGDRIPLSNASAVAVDAKSVWLLGERAPGVRSTGVLQRIDPSTRKPLSAPVRLGRQPVDVAAAGGSAWVSDAGGTVSRVIGHRVVARIRVGGRPSDLTADPASVWVLRRDDQTLVHVDPKTNQRIGAAVSLGKQIDAIALGGDTLWVAGADSSLSRLDARTGDVRGSPVSVVHSPLSLTADASGAWVGSVGDRKVQRVRARL